MIHFADVKLQYDRDRIFRRLRVQPGSTAYDYAASAFPELVRFAEERLHMVHCYDVTKYAPPIGLEEADRCTYRVTCLSSCSEEITDAIGALLEKGDFLEGYILNDLVNEAFFNGSDQMNRQIAAAMGTLNCRLTRRFSPGEGDLSIVCQTTLLEVFRKEPALEHIRLTDSYMLYPEKSMLYLYGADARNPKISVEHDCRVCPNTTCFFRSETCS